MKYDHYVALDWAQSNMAWAHSTRHDEKIETFDVRSDVQGFKKYLENLKGKTILTFEETSPAHWLYTELVGSVEKIIVCEPYTNHLLKSGPKTDRTDALKLLKLLKAEMLKPVFHSLDEFIYVRKIVSGHDDLIHALVQLKHRRSAMFRARGMRPSAKCLPTQEESFVLEGIDELILVHEQRRQKYEKELRRIARENLMAKNLTSIPGIGFIHAVKIAASVINPTRFGHKTGFLLYCGLQKYDVISGGRSYGRRSPKYSRKLKCVFKTAALVCARNTNGHLKKYYDELISEKGYPEHQARHALARRIAALALGVMKTGKPLEIK
jgi:transposase